MVKIRKDLVAKNKYNIKCPYSMKAEYITFHNTANDASAQNEIAYMIRNNNQVSYHFAVDDKEVVQGIPINRNAWHCGDGGNGTGNRKSIGVEVCYSESGGAKYKKAEKRAIKFIAQLLHERKWGVNRVKKHQDWSGKYCPHRVLSEGRWSDVIRAIQFELDKLQNTTKPSKPKPATSHTKPKKRPELAVDGSWGPATTRALQRHFKTTVDGVISGQPRNRSTRNIPSAEYGTTGSNLIRAMQRYYKSGIVDGKISGTSNLITAMQRKYNLKIVDGYVSLPSNLVKQIQRRLNNGTL